MLQEDIINLLYLLYLTPYDSTCPHKEFDPLGQSFEWFILKTRIKKTSMYNTYTYIMINYMKYIVHLFALTNFSFFLSTTMLNQEKFSVLFKKLGYNKSLSVLTWRENGYMSSNKNTHVETFTYSCTNTNHETLNLALKQCP